MRVPRLRGRAVAALAVATAGVVAAGFGVAWSFRLDPVPVPVEVTAPTPLDGARAAPNSISGRVVRPVLPVVDDWSDLAETSRTVTLLVDGGPSRTTTTDDWGRFAFTEVEPGRAHTVVVEAPERAIVRLAGIALLPGERRDLGRVAFGGPSTMTVTVTDDAGRPIEGAEVEAFADVFDDTYEQGFPMPEDLLKFERVPSSRARSAADGRAVLDVFGGVVWTIAAQAPGKARVVVPRRGWQTRWIALPDAAPLRGHVRDAAGAPLASALVLARVQPPIRDSHHGTRYESPALWHRTRTAADGSFVFTSLPPGTIDVLAGRAGSAPFAAHAVRFPDCDSVDIEVPGDAHISGRITDAASGAPIEGVVVIVREQRFGSADHCATDADGRYEFAAPGTGTWDSVRVAPPPGWTPTTPYDRTYDAMFPGDRRTADFTLRRTGTLTGRVPDAIGWENGVRVHAVFDDGRVYGRRSWGVVLADGRFLLEDVAAGRVAVFACALDRTWWAREDNWLELCDAISADPAARARASFDLPAGHAVHATLALIPAKPVENLTQYELTDTSKNRDYRVRIRVRTSDGGPLSDAWGYTSSSKPPPPAPPNRRSSPLAAPPRRTRKPPSVRRGDPPTDVGSTSAGRSNSSSPRRPVTVSSPSRAMTVTASRGASATRRATRTSSNSKSSWNRHPRSADAWSAAARRCRTRASSTTTAPSAPGRAPMGRSR